MAPWSHLVMSARLFRREPLMSLVLGAALVLSLGSVCCGLGAFAAPWFGCELFALQIGSGTGRRPPRSRAWLGAGLFLFGAVVMVASAAWLSTLGLGVSVEAVGDAGRTTDDDVRTVTGGVVGALLALIFIVPFLYAPFILVDRGGSIGGAALESARLVVRDGPLRHLGLSIASHLVQSSPVIVAAAVTGLWAGRSEVPWGVLGSLPLLAITVPLGQGMIVAAWLDRRGDLVEPRRARPAGRPGGGLTVALAASLLAPALSIALVGASLARPSRPEPGGVTGGEVLVDRALEGSDGERLSIAGTALSVDVEDGWVSITASDGGGAGPLPRPTEASAERVRVVRVRDAHGVEVTAAGQRWVTWVSRAGVRLDDGLRARFADRLPLTGLLVLAAALLLTPVIVVRVLVRLAQVRQLAAGDGSAPGLSEARSQAHRLGWMSAGLLSPLSLAALAVGVWAALF